ncbi:MAG: hypothetical protein AB7H80_08285 [Candidatus Kapaibacterium sp.]
MIRVQPGHIVLLFLFYLVFHNVELRGQGRESAPLFGAFVSYEYGLPLTLERSPGAVEWCTFCDGTGTSYDHRGRFGAFLQLSNSKNMTTDIRLSLGISSGEFTSTSYIAPLVDPVTSSTTQTDRFFTVSSLVANIEGGLQFKWNVVDRLKAGFGPWLSYSFLSRFIQRESLVAPAEITFPGTSERTRVVNEGALLGSGPISFGGTLSTSYEFLLFGHLNFAPELYTRIDAWGLTNGLGLRSLSAGTTFSFSQKPPRPILPALSLLPPQPIPPPPPPLSHLSTEVALHASDAEGRELEEIQLLARQTFYHRHTPPVTDWIIEDYILPPIGVTPSIRADAGIRSWSLSIRQDNQEIAYITSEDENQALNLSLDIVDGKVPRALIAELIVEDSTGAMTAARDQLLFSTSEAASNVSYPAEQRVEHQWVLPIITSEEVDQSKEILPPAQLVDLFGMKGEEIIIVRCSDSETTQIYAERLRKSLLQISPSLQVVIGTLNDEVATLPGEKLPGNSLLLILRHHSPMEN